MVVITRQTRRPARRADENAPPTNINGAPATRSRAADTSLTAKSASTVSSLPVMKRQSSSSAVPTNGKVLPLAKRSAFGDVTHISKNVETNGLKKDRKPLVSTRSSLQAPQRTRVSVISEVVLKKEGKAAPRRKVATSVKPISSSAPLTEKPLNVQGEREAEPARKRRKTSTPPPITDEESSEDEVPYTEDGREVFPGKIYHGGLKSPKRKSFAKDMGWTDLDAEDDGDPMMASEYVIDAFNYMLEVEGNTMPNANYMDKQSELQWKMRAILMDWLIEVHSKFRLLPETLFIATNLIDRFLSARVISLIKFQLVGVTALFVAAKYEEVICPSITHFLHMADGGYKLEEILKAERYMLSTLNYDLSYPNPLHFLRRISKADGYDIQSRTVAKYLLEISCVQHRLLKYPPSLLAAGAMYLARLCLERGRWTPNLVHYSNYSEDELLECAQVMLDHVLDPNFSTETSFYKKYAAKKHMKTSNFFYKWAIQRFDSEDRGDELAIFMRC